MSDKGLDEFFRKKLTNREFEFNAANWEAMEAMLDADKKPALFYWWTSAAVVLFGLMTAGIALFQNPILNEGVQPVSTTIETETPSVQTKSNDLDLKTLDTEGDVVSNSETSEIPTVQTQTNKEDLNVLDTEGDLVSNSVDDERSSDNLSNSGPSYSQNPQQKDTEGDKLKTTINSTGNGARTIFNQDGNQTAGFVNSATTVQAQDQKFTALSFINLLDRPIPELNYSISTQGNDPILPSQEFPGEAIRKFQKQHEFSMLAGIGAAPSFNNGSASTDWLIGLNYEYRFSFNWSVNAALSYTAKMSPGIVHNSDSIFHSFSPERVITKTEETRLDYLEMPIQFTRSFNSKHQLGFGVYSAVLFNIQTDVNRTNITIKETKQADFTESGLSENFRVLDYGLTGSYSYQFNPLLNLGFQFKYGLSDITVNNTQELSGYHRNISSRLILRYRLF